MVSLGCIIEELMIQYKQTDYKVVRSHLWITLLFMTIYVSLFRSLRLLVKLKHIAPALPRYFSARVLSTGHEP